MAILASRLDTIARKMANTLFRTARSGVLNSGHDFSCVILTADCRLLTAAESLPIHVMIGPDLMCRAVLEHHPKLARGDAFLHNSPYHGNSHAADQCLIVPVIDDHGRHRFWALCKAHQADIGNSAPTTYMGHARDVYQEGALIFPGVRVQRDYSDVGDIIRMCMARIRVPEQWWGDYLAALGAARIGERELLGARPRGRLGDARRAMPRPGSTIPRSACARRSRRLPSGRTVVETRHDPFPGVPDGIPLKIAVAIDGEDGRIEVDLRDNPDCQPCGLNLTEACALSTAMIGVYNGIADHTVPPNAGSFRRVEVKIRDNCVVGRPRHPFSCSVATTNLADRVSSPVQRAIAEIAAGFGMAEGAPIFPPAGGVISGNDPRRARGAVRQPGPPRPDRRRRRAHDRRLAHDRPRRQRRDLPPRRHRGRRARPPDPDRRAPPRPGQRGRRRVPRRARRAGRARADRGLRDADLLHRRRHDQPGTGRARRRARAARIEALKRTPAGELEPQPACGGVALSPGETIVSVSAGGGGYGRPIARGARAGRPRRRRGLGQPRARGRRSTAWCSTTMARSTRRHRRRGGQRCAERS